VPRREQRAHGATLVDRAGRELLDFHGNSVHQLGHGHPQVVAAITAELARLPFCPRRYTNRAAIALARRLVELAPAPLDKVLFAPSGAAAVAMALKLARLATGRHAVLSTWDAFHGANLDTISVGGEALFRRGAGPLLPGTEHLPPFQHAARFFGDDGAAFDRYADYLDYVLDVQGDVAAFIAEPLRWTTVESPPPGFWARVKSSCERHGTLLIFDEIPSCMGRTGTLFACEQAGATPDILVIGKGLGGGVMPLAAILAPARLDVAPAGALGHYTHEKSPLACAAGLAALEAIAAEGLLERAGELGRTGLERLEALRRRHPAIAAVRGIGCYFGVEIAGRDRPDAVARAERLMYGCLERGLSFKLGGGNVVTLCPPLTIAWHEFERAFEILGEALAILS
jgi:4-aminobutyrate aminotransferase